MSKKIVAYILIILGVLVVFIGLGAEVIGLGDGDGIGWVQILFAGIGVVMIIGGWDIQRDTKKE